jgi:hypothetical protein
MTKLIGTMTHEWAQCGAYQAPTEHDLCRLLAQNGYSSCSVTLLDAVTRKPRVLIPSVAKAALRCARETKNKGPHFTKWAPMPAGVFERDEAA